MWTQEYSTKDNETQATLALLLQIRTPLFFESVLYNPHHTQRSSNKKMIKIFLHLLSPLFWAYCLDFSLNIPWECINILIQYVEESRVKTLLILYNSSIQFKDGDMNKKFIHHFYDIIMLLLWTLYIVILWTMDIIIMNFQYSYYGLHAIIIHLDYMDFGYKLLWCCYVLFYIIIMILLCIFHIINIILLYIFSSLNIPFIS